LRLQRYVIFGNWQNFISKKVMFFLTQT